VTMNVRGTSTSGQAPQTSVAVSLTAGNRPNGTPIKGRFYLPPLTSFVAGNVEGAGRYPAATVAAVGGLIAQYFNALRGQGDVPSVWSRRLANVTAVTNARVGDVPDTIRSRRNALPEAYTSVWAPA
jgi:hypothetical protein